MTRSLTSLIFLALVWNCSRESIEALKRKPPETRFHTALQFYQKGDYWKARELLQTLVEGFQDHPLREDAMFYYAMAYYQDGEYAQAIRYFFDLLSTYPGTRHEEEARYYLARSYYALTLPYNLDQTLTHRTMELLRLFLRKFPQSRFREDCEEMLADLSLRLQRKAYYNAMVYFRTGKYRAARLALEQVLQDYPLHYARADIAWYLILSAYYYARKSAPELQAKRYQETLELIEQYRYLIEGTYREAKLLALEQEIRHKIQNSGKNHDDSSYQTE